jgi:hypothetical protein
MNRFAVLLAVWITSPAIALAGGGVLEINQACATRTGCFPGDAAGFPVTISTAGSYLLTGNLAVPESTRGIEITGNSATLDLRGFTVTGAGGTTSVDGVYISGQNAEVRNGSVRGFSRHGIFADGSTAEGNALGSRILDMRSYANLTSGIVVSAPGSTVERCTAANNALRGIDISNTAIGSLLTHSVARDNASLGIRVFPNTVDGATGWGFNVATNNNGGNANDQILKSTGAFEIGPNVCGSDLTCP